MTSRSTSRLRTEGTDHLLSAARAAGVRRFVAQSHILTYARTDGPVKSEDDPVDSTPAREMRSAAAAIRHLEEAVLGATWTEGIVLRYGHFYGPGTSMAPDGDLAEPHDIGAIHFVGIGGIGMSGIAEVLLNHGFTVQGSDLKASADHRAAGGARARRSSSARGPRTSRAREVVVISSAIKPGNPELDAARARNLPVVRRAEMLAELMRLKSNVAVAGTHGKTTTTSMVAALLDGGGMDPTVVNGGVIHAYGSNARIGQGEWMVVEADESDGTFSTACPRPSPSSPTSTPSTWTTRATSRALQARLRRLRLEHPVLRARGLLHRPSRGAGAGRARSPTAASRPTASTPQADVQGRNLRYEDGGARLRRGAAGRGPGDRGRAPCR